MVWIRCDNLSSRQKIDVQSGTEMNRRLYNLKWAKKCHCIKNRSLCRLFEIYNGSYFFPVDCT